MEKEEEDSSGLQGQSSLALCSRLPPGAAAQRRRIGRKCKQRERKEGGYF